MGWAVPMVGSTTSHTNHPPRQLSRQEYRSTQQQQQPQQPPQQLPQQPLPHGPSSRLVRAMAAMRTTPNYSPPTPPQPLPQPSAQPSAPRIHDYRAEGGHAAMAAAAEGPNPVVVIVACVISILVLVGFAVKWSFDMVRYDATQQRQQQRQQQQQQRQRQQSQSAVIATRTVPEEDIEDENGRESGEHFDSVAEQNADVWEHEEEVGAPLIVRFVKLVMGPRTHLGYAYDTVHGYIATVRLAQLLRATAAISARRVFSDTDVDRGAPIPANEDGTTGSLEEEVEGSMIPQKPLWDASEPTCSICLDEMDSISHQLLFCKYGCGQFLHQTCYDRNVAVNTSGTNNVRDPWRCPLCRSEIRLAVVPMNGVAAILQAYNKEEESSTTAATDTTNNERVDAEVEAEAEDEREVDDVVEEG